MPIYLTLGAFTQQAAVALSNSTILAGSIANVLCNGRKRHPFKDRPLVSSSSKTPPAVFNDTTAAARTPPVACVDWETHLWLHHTSPVRV
jgi:hypothetical protein